MQLDRHEINTIANGIYGITFGGDHEGKTFGIHVIYYPAKNKLGKITITPRQSVKKFHILILKAIAQEPPEYFK